MGPSLCQVLWVVDFHSLRRRGAIHRCITLLFVWLLQYILIGKKDGLLQLLDTTHKHTQAALNIKPCVVGVIHSFVRSLRTA